MVRINKQMVLVLQKKSHRFPGHIQFWSMFVNKRRNSNFFLSCFKLTAGMCQESCGYSFKSIHVIPGLTITRDSFNIDTKFIELQCHKDMSEPLVGEQLVHIDTYAIFNVIISNSAYSSASGRFASAFISMSKVCILDGVVKHLLYVQRVMGSNRGLTSGSHVYFFEISEDYP